MKKTNIENTLALAGALIVLIGVSAAASSVLAEETNTIETQVVVAEVTTETSVVIGQAASKAATEATDAAISSVSLENRLDLDIRLLDRKSLTATK